MKTKKTFLLLIILVISFSSFSQQITKDIIKGKWSTPSGDIIEIYEHESLYYGKIISLKESNDENGERPKDYLNPVKELRNRSLIGIDLLIGLEYDGDNEWNNGRIYLPSECLVLECNIEYVDRDRINLVIPLGLFTSETEIWRRKK